MEASSFLHLFPPSHREINAVLLTNVVFLISFLISPQLCWPTWTNSAPTLAQGRDFYHLLAKEETWIRCSYLKTFLVNDLQKDTWNIHTQRHSLLDVFSPQHIQLLAVCKSTSHLAGKTHWPHQHLHVVLLVSELADAQQTSLLHYIEAGVLHSLAELGNSWLWVPSPEAWDVVHIHCSMYKSNIGSLESQVSRQADIFFYKTSQSSALPFRVLSGLHLHWFNLPEFLIVLQWSS